MIGVMMPTKKDNLPRSKESIDYLLRKLRGMQIDNATVMIEMNGFRSRTTEINGKALVVTRDYRLDRINLRTKNDIVVDASIG
jgi:hypothetical protein